MDKQIDPIYEGLIRVDLEDLNQYEMPDAEFLLGRMIPIGQTTLLGAHGDSGKSNLALVMAAHIATGTNWAGMPVQQGKVLFMKLFKWQGLKVIKPEVLSML